jgi:hypothetical protein
MYTKLVIYIVKKLAEKAAFGILLGRRKAMGVPEQGRFLKHDVNRILNKTWDRVNSLLPEAGLENLPTKGNRINVLFALVTVSAYHALLNEGVQKLYAIELVSDIGWKVYTSLLPLPKLISRLITPDNQKQVNLILRMFMIFPFSTPGRPGYECNAWEEPGRFCTDWTHCPPFEFVQRYAEIHGDRGEIELYQRTWCEYDWALAYALVDGTFNVKGHYERPHTLSHGDKVCDMRWYAGTPTKS